MVEQSVQHPPRNLPELAPHDLDGLHPISAHRAIPAERYRSCMAYQTTFVASGLRLAWDDYKGDALKAAACFLAGAAVGFWAFKQWAGAENARVEWIGLACFSGLGGLVSAGVAFLFVWYRKIQQQATAAVGDLEAIYHAECLLIDDFLAHAQVPMGTVYSDARKLFLELRGRLDAGMNDADIHRALAAHYGLALPSRQAVPNGPDKEFWAANAIIVGGMSHIGVMELYSMGAYTRGYQLTARGRRYSKWLDGQHPRPPPEPQN